MLPTGEPTNRSFAGEQSGSRTGIRHRRHTPSPHKVAAEEYRMSADAPLPFQDDPRVAQAIALLDQVVADAGRDLNDVRPADPTKVDAYRARLEEFARLRAGALYYPYLATGRGHGPYVELADGSVKLDFINGIGVHGFGHAHRAMRHCGIRAAICDTVMQGNLQQADASVDLCRRLVELARRSGAAIEHVAISTSGAMSNENALKLAFHARPGRNRLLAFERCFAGRTLVLSQLTDKAAFRVNLPTDVPIDYLPFCDASDVAGSTERTLAAMRRHVGRYPNRHAAIWFELVQGEGGYNVGDRSYLHAICAEARKLGIPIVFDEVQTFGRTTRPFAFQHFGLDEYAELVTVGKITQACATLFSAAFAPGPGLISQTFTAGTWELLAAIEVLDRMAAGNLFGPEGSNARLHARFAAGLERIAERTSGAIRGPWGIGGMIALTPLEGRADQAKRLAELCFDEGLMGFVAGAEPTRLRFLPPLLAIDDAMIDRALELLGRAVGRLVAEFPR